MASASRGAKRPCGWLRRWLADDDRAIREPSLVLQSDAQLRVTVQGQVIDEFADEVSVVALAEERAVALAEKRRAAWTAMSRQQRQATIFQTIGFSPQRGAKPRRIDRGCIVRSGYTIEKLTIERPGCVPLAGLLFVPAAGGSKSDPAANKTLPAVLYVDGRGKAADAQAGGAVESLVGQGQIVLSLDVRGSGETADVASENRYHNDEFRTAMLAMHIGRPLVGQRVDDLLAALDVLSGDERVDAEAIRLVGVGRAAPVALHAAALKPRFKTVQLRDSITSWIDDVVRRPLAPNAIGLVVPGALEHYDLDDLVVMLGNRVSIERTK